MNRGATPPPPPPADSALPKRLEPVMRRLRFRRVGRLPLLALLALGAAVGAALLGPPSADPVRAQSPAEQTVPADWPLIPDGVEPGDSFRLLFVTSTGRDASSADIGDYNAHVQAAANNNTTLAGFSAGFRALISTAAVDARDNTATTGTGVSVHWLGGAKVAEDYADLYDKSWDSVNGKTETGAAYAGLVWTGGNKAGQKSGRRFAGTSEVRLGDLGGATSPLSSPSARASSETFPLYALSPVITVAQPQSGEPVNEGSELQSAGDRSANSPPRFAAGSASVGVAEDTAIGAEVGGPIAVTDPDGDELTFSLRGSDDFAIDESSGQLRVAGALNYEAKRRYRLTVFVSDGKDAAGAADDTVDDSVAIRVNVVNVDEPGRLIFNMHTPQARRALQADVIDPDGDASDVSWSWARSVDRIDWQTIDGATGASYTPSDGDVGSYLRATASYTDPHGPGKTARHFRPDPVEAFRWNLQPSTVGAFLHLSPAFISEAGGVSTVSATLSATASTDTVITISATAVSPAVARDFSLSANRTLTIPAGQLASSGVVTITAVDNSSFTGNKIVNVSGSINSNALGDSPELVIAEDDYTCTGSTATPSGSSAGLIADCEALLAARDVLAGTTYLNWSTDADITSWDGVSVSDTDGRVTTLDLEDEFLSGVVPSGLAKLDALTDLRLPKNDLSGGIPAALGDMPSLEVLYLQENRLTGRIPAALGRLARLSSLDLSDNQLEGPLPPEMGQLASLRTLYLRDNNLSGMIPAEWARLNIFQFGALGLERNSLTGEVTLEVTPLVVSEAGGAKEVTVVAVLDPGTAWANGYLTYNFPRTDASVRVSVAAGTATEGVDFSAVTDVTIVVPRGKRSASGKFTLTPISDNVPEPRGETVVISATGMGGHAASEITLSSANRPTVRILDGANVPNSPPIFLDGARVALSVDEDDEDSPAGTPIGTFAAIDADGDTLTYGLKGPDADAFAIDGSGRISALHALDYERRDSYSIIATVSDGKNAAGRADRRVDDTIELPISVVNLDEPGTLSLSLSMAAVGLPVVARLSDPDGGIGHVYLKWESAFSKDGSFSEITGATVFDPSIPSSTYGSYTPVAADEGMWLRASAIYRDNYGFNRMTDSAAVLVSDPPKLADFRVIPGDGQVALSWSVPRDEHAPLSTRWQVWRSRGGAAPFAGEWTRVALEYNAYLRRDEIRGHHVVDDLANGRSYTFHVAALHPTDDTKLSLLSAPLSIAPWASRPPEAQIVPADWPLIPRWHGHELVGPGQSFRLMIVTSSKVAGDSSDIEFYNTLAQMDASRNGLLVNVDGQDFSGEFRALVSTRYVDARDNTASTGRGVPIFYLGGPKVADDYADFYDGDWDYPACAHDETGEWLCWGLAWTGSQADGTKDPISHVGRPASNVVRYASVPQYDTLSGATMDAKRCEVYSYSERRVVPCSNGASKRFLHLYALSPVLTVAPAE